MTIEISPVLLEAQQIARYQAIAGALAGGALVCYPAPRPAPGGVPAWPAIVRVPFAPGVGSVGAGGLDITAPVEGQVTQSGVIAWGRFETSAGTWLLDCDVVDLQLDATTVLSGAFVRLLEARFA